VRGELQGIGHLAKRPEFGWMREILRDLPARGWAKFGVK
jgi:hypothetical protein